MSTLRHQRGRWAEERAAQALLQSGYRVVDRNVRVGSLELDIVARDGPTIVVVEVRCRGAGAWTRPLSSVDRTKQERIGRAAGVLWASRWSHWRGVERVRFDVITVDPGGRVDHVRAAFCSDPKSWSFRVY